MHFIEDLFGFAPDGGSGLTELLMFLVSVVGCLIVLYLRRVGMKSAK
jgi:hypothetical protein